LSGVEAVKRIVETEREAESIIEEAREKSREIRIKTEKEKDEVKKKVAGELKRERERIFKDVEDEAKKECQEIRTQTEKQLKTFQDRFLKNKDKAVDAVLSSILGESGRSA